MTTLEGGAVGAGVGVGLALAVPAVLLAQVVDSVLDNGVGAWVLLVLLAVVVAIAVSGAVAARRAAASPFLHAGVAGVGTYALVQAIAVTRLIAAGDEVSWAAIPLFAVVAAAVGICGAALEQRWSRR